MRRDLDKEIQRNNLKIMGVEENLTEEKSRDGTEKLVKKLTKES